MHVEKPPISSRQREARVVTFRTTLLNWGRRHRRSFPWRASRDPYEVLLGDLLLQRTRGEHVVPVYLEMLHRWPTPARLARARVDTIARVIKPLGLAKRAAVIKRFAVCLDRDFGGEVPRDPRATQRIPGVGPYAAHAVQVFARRRDLPLVDWVIARVLRRYFGLPDRRRPNADPDLWSLAEQLVADGQARQLWLGVLDFGAQVCTPRPRCPECPLSDSCSYRKAQRSKHLISVTPPS